MFPCDVYGANGANKVSAKKTNVREEVGHAQQNEHI